MRKKTESKIVATLNQICKEKRLNPFCYFFLLRFVDAFCKMVFQFIYDVKPLAVLLGNASFDGCPEGNSIHCSAKSASQIKT